MEIKRPSSSSNISSTEQKQEQKSETSIKQINTGISKAQDSFETVQKNPLLDNLIASKGSSGSPTADQAETSAPGDNNNPIATDNTSSNPQFDTPSGLLNDVANMYNQQETSLETMFSKLKDEAKDDEGSKTSKQENPQRTTVQGLKDSLKEDNQTKKDKLEKLRDLNQMNKFMSEQIKKLANSSQELAAMEQDDNSSTTTRKKKP